MNEITKPPQASDNKTVASPMPSKHTFKPLKQCTTLEEAFQTSEFHERIAASVPQHVQPGRMLRTFVSAVSKTPLLAKADLRTFLGACLTCSQVGLEPNTPLGHIWLLPFKSRRWNPRTRERDIEVVEVNVIFGYPGLLDLSYRTTKVKAIHADVAWPNDEFSFEYGTDAHLRHRPRPHKSDDRPLYAYMHAGLDGGQAFEVMPYDDVLSIRNRSQAYRTALAAKEKAETEGWRVPATWTEAPWVAHEIAMARKTVFRSGSKWLPRSVELASAIALDEAQERRKRMDFGRVMDAPTIDGTPDYLGAATEAAQTTEDEAEPAGVDAGAAHTDRRIPQTPAPTRGRAREPKSVTPPAPSKPPASDPPAASFEALLIGSDGDPDETIHDDARGFVAAYAGLWRVANPSEREALAEFNADALADASAHDPDAAATLTALLEENDATGQTSGPPSGHTAPVVIEPPIERGAPSWTSYGRAMRAALGEQTAQGIEAWLEAQRETLTRATISARVLVIRAIAERCGALERTPPAWLVTLTQANRPRPVQDAPPQDQAAPADGGDPRSSDERWVDARIADLRAMHDPAAFDLLSRSPAVQRFMARLARDNPDLFNRANIAFSAKRREMEQPRASTANDGPPDPEDGDPGPGGDDA